MSKKAIFLTIGLIISVAFFVKIQPATAADVSVVYPNGGETLILGEVAAATWNQSGAGTAYVELIKNDASQAVIQIVSPKEFAAGQNMYPWTVPASITTGNDYKVRVQMVIAGQSNAVDYSDNFFNISLDYPPGTLPDLTIEEVKLDPAYPKAGEKAILQIGVGNRGTRTLKNSNNLIGHNISLNHPANSPFYYALVRKLPDGCSSTASMDPGGVCYIYYDFTYPVSANLIFTIEVDQGNTIEELNENNNTFNLNFTVLSGMYQPILISPSNGAVVASNYPNLVWASVPDAKSYQYKILDAAENELQSWNIDSKSGSSMSVSTNLISGSYGWKVRSCSQLINVVTPSDSTCGMWSHTWYFTISSAGITALPYPNGTLVKTSSSDKIYLIENNQKRWITSTQAFLAYRLKPNSEITISQADLDKYSTGLDITIATPNLSEGALIRAIGDVDVWIVKYVGAKKFKRLILSPSVFNSYGHLKWGDIKDVDKSIVDSFIASDLVRAVNDSAIYKLYPAGDVGQRRWVKTADAFSRLGYDWDSVYQINSKDRDSYNAGAAIE